MNNRFWHIARRLQIDYPFTIFCVVTICLAVGINLGVFVVDRAALHSSLGVPESNRLVYYTMNTGSGSSDGPFSGRAFESLGSLSPGSDLLAWNLLQVRVGTGEQAKTVTGALVSHSSFSVLRIHPALGTFFVDDSDAIGGGRQGWTAILSYRYWKTVYGGDPAIIGKLINVDGEPVQVQGVLPPTFKGLTPPIATDILLPLRFQDVSSPKEDRYTKPGYFDWYVFGRMKPNNSIDSIRANLKAIQRQFRDQADPEHWLFSGEPVDSYIHVTSGEYGTSEVLKIFRVPLFAMKLVGFGLFVLCGANLAFLFVGRAIRERHSAALRVALGASRSSIIGDACAEASVLAIIGGIFAVPTAWAIARLLILMARSIPGVDSFQDVAPDKSIFALGLCVSLIIANASAVLAALWCGEIRPSSVMSSAQSAKRTQFVPLILGAEVAVGLSLLVVALVSVQSVYRLSRMPSGFDENTVVASLELAGGSRDPVTNSQHLDDVEKAIEQYPGVLAASSINIAPLSGASSSSTYARRTAGQDPPQKSTIWNAVISPHYLDASGTRLISGRDFEQSGDSNERSCLISQRAATGLFGEDSPLNQSLYQSTGASRDLQWEFACQIIGVVGDTHFKSMSDLPEKVVYRFSNIPMQNVLVRAKSTEIAREAITRALRTSFPNGYSVSINTIAELGRVHTI